MFSKKKDLFFQITKCEKCKNVKYSEKPAISVEFPSWIACTWPVIIPSFVFISAGSVFAGGFYEISAGLRDECIPQSLMDADLSLRSRSVRGQEETSTAFWQL